MVPRGPPSEGREQTRRPAGGLWPDLRPRRPQHALLSSRPLLEKRSRRLAQPSPARRAGTPASAPPFPLPLLFAGAPNAFLAPKCGSEDARAPTAGAHGAAGEDTQAPLWGHPEGAGRRGLPASASAAEALHEGAPRGLARGGRASARESWRAVCASPSQRPGTGRSMPQLSAQAIAPISADRWEPAPRADCKVGGRPRTALPRASSAFPSEGRKLRSGRP